MIIDDPVVSYTSQAEISVLSCFQVSLSGVFVFYSTRGLEKTGDPGQLPGQSARRESREVTRVRVCSQARGLRSTKPQSSQV